MAMAVSSEAPPVPRFSGYRRFSRLSAAACIAIGLVVVAGWAFHVAPLKSLLPQFVAMMPNTALGLLLGGLALWVAASPSSAGTRAPARRRRVAAAAAAALALVGLLTCLEFLLGADLHIDELLFRDPDTAARLAPHGRMSPLTAANFAMLGAALLLLDRPRARRLVDVLCVTALLCSGLVIAGYVYRVPVFFAVWANLAVALHTAVGVGLLALGILFARPDRGLLGIATSDGAGGLMARRLLPAAILLSPALGWLCLLGERAGYYDGPFDLALYASSNVVLFATLIFWNGRSLRRLDDVRRAQEAHLRLVVHHSPAGIAMFDRDMRYLVVSPRWIKDYGLEGREILGKSHYEVFPEIPERWKEIHRRCLAGATARQDEDPFPRADGTVDWVRWEIAPWRTAGGGIGGILMFSEVITDRKRAEERFHATFEQAAVGIAHADPEGRWLRVNTKLAEILGYPKEDLVGRVQDDLTHPDDVEAARTHVRRLLSGETRTSSLEKRFFRKDLSVVWVNLTRSLVRHGSGSPDYVIVVIEDITRRKEAESRLRSLWESDLIGVVVSDATGRVLEANAAFRGMLGTAKEDPGTGALPAMGDPEGLTAPQEREFVRKDGSRLTALVGGRRIQGSADQVVSFVLDLSEQKQLEEQLRQSQRMEVVGRLAGGVAHDFNNLLTPIMGYADLILDRLKPDDPLRDDVSEIRRSAERSATLTRQLLAFSRKQVLQPKALDLNVLIGDAAKLLRRLIGEDVTLQLALSRTPVRVRVDPGQMEQVLMNLAVNARDAMPGGGVLTIGTAVVALDGEYASRHAEVTPGPHAMMTVSDTGTGMTKEVQARLFEPFFTTKPQGKGTGLGLATAHGIVKQSRGHIWVYSEVGRGTTFKVHLPELREEEEQEEAARAAGSGPAASVTGTETVLMVEDDEALRAFAGRVLRSKGYVVLEARGGEAALRESKGHRGSIDLLLTDVVMPGMSGREVAQQLRGARPRMRVLFMSGYTEDTIGHHGVLDEGTDLLEKPFTPDGLLTKVRLVLDRDPQNRPSVL